MHVQRVRDRSRGGVRIASPPLHHFKSPLSSPSSPSPPFSSSSRTTLLKTKPSRTPSTQESSDERISFDRIPRYVPNVRRERFSLHVSDVENRLRSLSSSSSLHPLHTERTDLSLSMQDIESLFFTHFSLIDPLQSQKKPTLEDKIAKRTMGEPLHVLGSDDVRQILETMGHGHRSCGMQQETGAEMRWWTSLPSHRRLNDKTIGDMKKVLPTFEMDPIERAHVIDDIEWGMESLKSTLDCLSFHCTVLKNLVIGGAHAPQSSLRHIRIDLASHSYKECNTLLRIAEEHLNHPNGILYRDQACQCILDQCSKWTNFDHIFNSHLHLSTLEYMLIDVIISLHRVNILSITRTCDCESHRRENDSIVEKEEEHVRSYVLSLLLHVGRFLCMFSDVFFHHGITHITYLLSDIGLSATKILNTSPCHIIETIVSGLEHSYRETLSHCLLHYFVSCGCDGCAIGGGNVLKLLGIDHRRHGSAESYGHTRTKQPGLIRSILLLNETIPFEEDVVFWLWKEAWEGKLFTIREAFPDFLMNLTGSFNWFGTRDPQGMVFCMVRKLLKRALKIEGTQGVIAMNKIASRLFSPFQLQPERVSIPQLHLALSLVCVFIMTHNEQQVPSLCRKLSRLVSFEDSNDQRRTCFITAVFICANILHHRNLSLEPLGQTFSLIQAQLVDNILRPDGEHCDALMHLEIFLEGFRRLLGVLNRLEGFLCTSESIFRIPCEEWNMPVSIRMLSIQCISQLLPPIEADLVFSTWERHGHLWEHLKDLPSVAGSHAMGVVGGGSESGDCDGGFQDFDGVGLIESDDLLDWIDPDALTEQITRNPSISKTVVRHGWIAEKKDSDIITVLSKVAYPALFSFWSALSRSELTMTDEEQIATTATLDVLAHLLAHQISQGKKKWEDLPFNLSSSSSTLLIGGSSTKKLSYLQFLCRFLDRLPTCVAAFEDNIIGSWLCLMIDFPHTEQHRLTQLIRPSRLFETLTSKCEDLWRHLSTRGSWEENRFVVVTRVVSRIGSLWQEAMERGTAGGAFRSAMTSFLSMFVTSLCARHDQLHMMKEIQGDLEEMESLYAVVGMLMVQCARLLYDRSNPKSLLDPLLHEFFPVPSLVRGAHNSKRSDAELVTISGYRFAEVPSLIKCLSQLTWENDAFLIRIFVQSILQDVVQTISRKRQDRMADKIRLRAIVKGLFCLESDPFHVQKRVKEFRLFFVRSVIASYLRLVRPFDNGSILSAMDLLILIMRRLMRISVEEARSCFQSIVGVVMEVLWHEDIDDLRNASVCVKMVSFLNEFFPSLFEWKSDLMKWKTWLSLMLRRLVSVFRRRNQMQHDPSSLESVHIHMFTNSELIAHIRTLQPGQLHHGAERVFMTHFKSLRDGLMLKNRAYTVRDETVDEKIWSILMQETFRGIGLIVREYSYDKDVSSTLHRLRMVVPRVTPKRQGLLSYVNFLMETGLIGRPILYEDHVSSHKGEKDSLDSSHAFL